MAGGPSRPRTTDRVDEWSTQLEALAGGLVTLLHGSEAEFLSIGERLQAVSTRADELVTEARHAGELASGAELSDALNELAGQLERLEQHIEGSEQGFSSSIAMMQSLLTKVGALVGCDSNFRQVSRTLRILAVGTRIESAHLSSSHAGFDALADDVRALGERVSERFHRLLVRAAALAKLVTRVLQESTSAIAAQRRRAAGALDDAALALGQLSDVNATAAGVCGRVSDKARAIGDNVTELVISLQSHDITRQRIEHVVEALRATGTAIDGTPDGLPAAASLVADSATLQRSQLAHARIDFVGAVRTMVESLGKVAESVLSVVTETQSIGGARRTEGASFLARIERAIGAIATALRVNAEAAREIAEVMTSVARDVAEMEKFVRDIDGIGQEAELLALNAIVKTAQAGEDGGALGVLAREIQRLSSETRGSITEIASALAGIAEEARGLERSTSAMRDRGTLGADQIAGELDQLLGTLRRVDGEFLTSVEGVRGGGKRLSEDLRTLAGKVRIHQEMTRVSTRVEQRLGLLGDTARVFAGASEDARRSDRLQEVTAVYTMESERAVHESIAAAKDPLAIATELAPEAARVETPTEWGNVELF